MFSGIYNWTKAHFDQINNLFVKFQNSSEDKSQISSFIPYFKI